LVRVRNAWLTLTVLAGFALIVLSTLGSAGDLEARLGTSLEPAVSGIRDIVRPAADIILRAGQIDELSEENTALRQELGRAQAELAALREQSAAGEQVQALLAAVGDSVEEFLPASVVLRDPAPGRETLLIDRGAEDGVLLGQPVLGAGATLVGTIVEVGPSRARVRLLNDRDSVVAALVQSSRTPGSLAGDGESLRLDFVPVDSPVSVGDIIVSSSLGGLLPTGLPIGRVSEVRAPDQELFGAIEVAPLADYRRLEQLLVMTSFQAGIELPVGAGADADDTGAAR
jgi:rod shape-determining protein MreC